MLFCMKSSEKKWPKKWPLTRKPDPPTPRPSSALDQRLEMPHGTTVDYFLRIPWTMDGEDYTFSECLCGETLYPQDEYCFGCGAPAIF